MGKGRETGLLWAGAIVAAVVIGCGEAPTARHDGGGTDGEVRGDAGSDAQLSRTDAGATDASAPNGECGLPGNACGPSGPYCCSNRDCVQGRCAACTTEGSGCLDDAECCGPAVCNPLLRVCDCPEASLSCGGDDDCCRGQVCHEGSCRCSAFGERCVFDEECCVGQDLTCEGGRCRSQGSRHVGDSCIAASDCDLGDCVGDVCCSSEGGPCRADADCCNVPGLFCNSSSECGFCQPLGQRCSAPSDCCAPLGCDGGCCARSGQPCGTSFDCCGTYTCSSTGTCCAPRDSPCTSDSDCCSGEGLICDPVTQVCRLPLGTACTGGSCGGYPRVTCSRSAGCCIDAYRTCSNDTECCSGRCVSGKCDCSAHDEACGGCCDPLDSCTAGTCCRAYGQSCSSGTPCCAPYACRAGSCN